MMTTNHMEALDPALLRPGRIDYKLYLGNASDTQKVDLYLRFFPDAAEEDAREFVTKCAAAETMAEFQGLLLGHAEDTRGLRSISRPVRQSAREEVESVPA